MNSSKYFTNKNKYELVEKGIHYLRSDRHAIREMEHFLNLLVRALLRQLANMVEDLYQCDQPHLEFLI